MNYKHIRRFFGDKESIYARYPKRSIRGQGDRKHVYVDNGREILLVAHIDTVRKPRLDTFCTGAGFDDRLGIFLCDYLMHQRPWFDLLLCDFEETGHSTAQYFNPSHKYNFVLELDREGDDFVDYDLASDDMLYDLEKFGFKHSMGSFSDICYLDHLDCSKINMGVGYFEAHALDSGFNPTQTQSQIKKLLRFLDAYHNVRYELPDNSYSSLVHSRGKGTVSNKDYFQQTSDEGLLDDTSEADVWGTAIETLGLGADDEFGCGMQCQVCYAWFVPEYHGQVHCDHLCKEYYHEVTGE